MKILITILLLFLAGCTNQPEMMGEVDIVDVVGALEKTEYVTAPENNAYKIGQLNYDAALATDITSDRPLQYQLDDKYLSFKPISIKWDTEGIKTIKPTTAIISEDKYEYKDAFGEGIDIDLNFRDRVFEKIVKINSLKDLGDIPKDAEYLEIEFEIETNFVLDGWDGKTDFEITDKLRVGDLSYLKEAKAWDSYSEEVCHLEYETFCDPECTEDTETCDMCDPPAEVCEIAVNRINIKSYLKNNNGKIIYQKQIPVEWLKNAQYPIWTDADVTYGTELQFESGITWAVRVVELDTDKFVVCYIDDSAGEDGCCRVATVSGTTMEFGTMSCFDTDVYVGNPQLGLAKLDTDKFAVAYADDGSDDDGYTRAVTVSDTTIETWGTAVEFEDSDSEWVHCDKLDTNKYVCCWNDEGDDDTGKCGVNTVSGTTITLGAATAMDGDGGSTKDYQPLYNAVLQLDTDKFVVCFEEEESGDDGYCVAGSVSTRTITFGTPNQFTTNNAISHGNCLVDTDKFINCYRDASDASSVQCIAATVSGITITAGSKVELNGFGDIPACIGTDSTHFVVAYTSYTDGKGYSRYSSVDFGTRVITLGDVEIFNNETTGGGSTDLGLSAALISSDKIVICYQDDADSDRGKCIIGDTPASEPPATGNNRHWHHIIIFD